MNKKLYRIVFNERRGQLMVVGDNVVSAGKAARGEGGAATGSGRWSPLAAALRPLCHALSAAVGMGAWLAVPVHAQVVADPNAPGVQRPTVLRTSNGVVQVNIQTPSTAGVSRNVYSQFDVTAGGVVLNNSRTDVKSQIGGWVQGNPWLATGNARVILNEINSADPSQLRGYLEVAGQRAELVIANPAGVNVDGGGFINASRVTVTTGTPRMNEGSLEGYLVQRGTVSVNGQGMDATQADYAGIIARAVKVNAGVWAKELQVITGANQVDAAHAVAVPGAGPAPSYALDVAYLGGMYAGKITLVGTEAGLGVRNAGLLAASSGDLVLQSNGWLGNSGSIQATAVGTNVRLDVVGDIDNAGTVYAAGNSRVTGGANITISGLIAAQNDTVVLAQGATSRIDATRNAILASGLNMDGTFGASGDLQAAATTGMAFHGTGSAGGNIDLLSAGLDLTGVALSGSQVALTAGSGSVDASRASVNARDVLTLSATETMRTDAAQVAAKQLSVRARSLSNVGGEIAQFGTGDLAISLPGTLDNTSGRIAVNSDNLVLGVDTLINTDGKLEHAGAGTLTISAGTLSGQRGQVTGNGKLDIAAGDFDHRGASTFAQQVTITASNLDNRGGQIAQLGSGSLSVAASGRLDNGAGRIESNGNAAIGAATLDNSGGRISIAGGATIGASAGLVNTDGMVAAGATLNLAAGNVDNTRGLLQAQGGDATLRVADLNNTAGSVYAAGSLDTTAANVANSGSMYAVGNQHLVAGGAITNSGEIAAQGHTTVSASSLASTASSLLGAGIRADGHLAQAGDLAVSTTGALAAHGRNVAAGELSLDGVSADVSGSQTDAANIALHASAGNVTTSNASVVASGMLSVTATAGGQSLVNRLGTLSAEQLDLQVASLDNSQGALIQSGTGDTHIVLTAPGGTLDNTQGRIVVNSGNLTIGAGALVNTDGRIEHAGGGQLAIAAGTLDGQRGQVTGNGRVDIRAGEFNHNGANTSGRAVSVTAGNLANRGGQFLQSGAGDMALQIAGQLDNTGGEIAADGNLGLHAGMIDNSQGRITSAATAQVTGAGSLSNGDGLLAAAHALSVTGLAVDNTRGAIRSGDAALTLNAASLLNIDGVLSAGTDLSANLGGELRNYGVMYAGRNQALNVGGAFTNTGSVASMGNTSITAGSVVSGAGSLLGAGIKADGSLVPAGSLTVSATQNLQAAGQNVAAGNASLSGAAVDLGGSQTGAANIDITATGGNISTRLVNLSTAGTLSVTANAGATQTLDNAQGSLSAGQLDLHMANLNNGHGTIIQTGGGDTDITLSAPAGTLDNTSGRIAANSGNLTLGAGTLINTDGKIEHAGGGTLAISAATLLSGQRGQIAGNGNLDITAGQFDHRGASTAAQQVTITATSLDNRAGQFAQLGSGSASIMVSSRLDNGAGRIASNGAAIIGAATLDNSGGLISAAGSAIIGSSNGLVNTDGMVAAGARLNVIAGNVDNTRGVLQAQGGDVTLRVADLNNAAGGVYAGASLDTTAANVANSGSMYATGSQHLAATGAIVNSGVIAARGSTTVTAGSLDSAAGSLLGAGIKADGGLAQTGNLGVTTTGALAAHGQNLAGGQLSLDGASTDAGGSQTSAANIALRASAGNVTTSNATIAATGTLAVTAKSGGQSLANRLGTLSASQLDLQVANLDNTQGALIQRGGGDTSIVLTAPGGTLNNTQGRIAVNSANLTLGAGLLENTGGSIAHAGNGALAITADALNGQRGEITGNGSLRITANNFDHRAASTVAQQVMITTATLDNREGSIIQLGSGAAAIGASNTLDNRGGVIASNGATSVSAGSLNNQGGVLQAAGSASLELAVAGTLDNSSAGRIAAGGNATLNAGSILNQFGQISAGAVLDATAAMALQNNQGLLAANGDVRLIASTLDNSGGKIASVTGNAGVTSGGLTANDGGVIQAGGDITLHSGGLSNAQAGAIVGRSIAIDTSGQTLNNRQGTLASTQTLDVRSGSLFNDAGLIQAGAALAIDTGGSALSNTSAGVYSLLHPSSVGGIVSGGPVALSVGNWYNAGGFFGAGGAVSGSTGQIDNTAGQIAGQSSLNLAIAGLVNNGGQVQALGDITFNAGNGAIDNSASLIRSSGTLVLTGGAIHNRNTQGADQGIEGRNIALNTDYLLNDNGAIRADGDATINSSGSVLNGQGLISAGGNLKLTDAGVNRILAIANYGGTLIGGNNTNIRAAMLGGDGRLLSLGDMSLDLGSYINGAGEVTANNNASVILAGDLVNSGKLRAGAALTISAANIDNQGGGEISAGATRVTAAGTLSNRGLIDGVDTQVNAGTLNNTGTGRIYGDHLSIAASLLNNDAEAGVAATIAARNRLDIGVNTLSNSEHALIFSAGDMVIGGALDANRCACGRADTINNGSATIEALGSLSLSASQVNNLNNHFSTAMGPDSAPESIIEYQGQGDATRYLAGTPGVYTYIDESLHLHTPAGNFESWTQYDTTRTTRQTVIASSDPGRIVAGGDLAIDANNTLNENSHIIAGGRLSIDPAKLSNLQTQGEKITSESGKATSMWRDHHKGIDSTGSSWTYYTPPDTIESISMNGSRVDEYTGSSGSGAIPGAVAGSVNGSISAAGVAGATVNQGAIIRVAASVQAISATDGHEAIPAQGVNGASGSSRGESLRATSMGAVNGARALAASGADAGASAEGMLGNAIAGAVGEHQSAASATAASGTGRPSQAHMSPVVQVALAHPSGGAQVVRTGVPSIQLPNASIYKMNPGASAHYLIETDPRFTNQRQWMGSDYMMAQLQLDPEMPQKRLGDGYYEQTLLREQVAQLTGQRFLGDYTNDDDEYRALMDAGVAYAKTWNLRPGVALTAAQMAALTDDIVWMVQQDVTLADGSVQKVLVPKVYARVREGDLEGNGALLAGKDVDIRVGGELVNSGSISGRNVVSVAADNVQNLRGRMNGDAVSVRAKTDLNNIGGAISANSELIAVAGRDINIETTTRSAASAAGGNSFARTTIDRVGGMYVTGDGSTGTGTLVASAGRDLNLLAGQIGNAGKDAVTVLQASNNLNLGTVTTASSNSLNWGANNYRKDSSTTEVGSQVQASGAILLKAGADINTRVADVQAGSSLNAVAGHNINVVAGVNAANVDEGHQRTEKSFLHSEIITTRDTLDRSSALGSNLGGTSVNLVAGNDIKVAGSTIAGDAAVGLTAKNDITITAVTDTTKEGHARNVEESGFLSAGGFGISYGKRTTSTDQQQDASLQSGQARSLVGSAGGNLTLNSGATINVVGSDLMAGQDINLSGKSVTITPGQDQVDGKFTSKMTQDGVTLAVGGSVVNSFQTMQAMGEAASQAKNSRVTAMAAATAAMAARDMAKNGVSVNVSLTAGHSESEMTRTTASTTHSGSTLAAVNNVAISATGSGKDSNITIVGSDIGAGNNIALKADNDVNLLAAQDLESQHSQSKSLSAAAGVSAGYSTKDGLAVGATAGLSASRSTENGEGRTQLNSHVNAGGQLAIASGGDTNLKGAVASGAQVVADIGGNLNIESLQDTAKFDSKNQSVSVSATVGYGASVSASANQGKVHSDYASVQEQSGIRAGDGGFQVKIAGNTDLKGATIGSTVAGAAASSLTTATLTQSDIENHSAMEASSVSLYGSATSGGGDGEGNKDGQRPGGTNLMNVGPTGTRAGLPGIASTSDSHASTTKSGIGAAALTITDDAAQRLATGKGAQESVAVTNRGATTGETSGRLANSFDLGATRATLSVTSAFTGAAAPLAAKLVGDVGAAKEKEADTAAADFRKQANDAMDRGDTHAADSYNAQAVAVLDAAKPWGDNGAYRLALHAGAQGLIGGLAGGNAGAISSVSGVAGGNLGQQLGKTLGEDEAKKLGLKGKERESLINTYQQTLASVGGAVAGLAASGASGQKGAELLAGSAQAAGTATAVDVFNRQLHPSERKFIDKKAKELAIQSCKPGDERCSAIAQRYWNDQLTAEAEASDDTRQAQQRQAYLKQVEATGLIPGQEGQITGAATKYMQDAQIARTVLEELRGQAIAGTDGKSVTADGATLTYFSGTQTQRNDHALYAQRIGVYDRRVSENGSADIVVPQQEGILRAGRDSARIERLSVMNGATKPDYTIEEFLLGGGGVASKTALKAGKELVSNAVTSNVERSSTKAFAAEEARMARIDLNIARDSDLTTGLRSAEDVNKLFADRGFTAPFTKDTYVAVTVSKPGAQSNMVVSDLGQAQAIDAGKPAFGNFATPDEVLSQAYARDKLAITPAMKPDVSKVVPIETTGKPMVQVEGKIAPQNPIGLHSGNENQIFFDYPAGSNRLEYVSPTGPTQSLPALNTYVPSVKLDTPKFVPVPATAPVSIPSK